MENDEKEHGRRRQQPAVPVFPEEKDEIGRTPRGRASARRAICATWARATRSKGVMDYQHVRELVRVNGDLGLWRPAKLWLTDDVRTLQFGEATIPALLGRIEATQDEMSRIMKAVVQPRPSLDFAGG